MIGIGIPIRPYGRSVPSLFDLNFEAGSYQIGRQQSSDFSAMPGVTYSRTGSRYAETQSGSTVLYTANQPSITNRGLLIEAAATQIMDWSSDFSNAEWSVTDATKTVNSALAPDGTMTACLITMANGGGLLSNSTQAGTVNGQPYAMGFWVKSTTHSGSSIGIRSGQSGQSSAHVMTTSWQRISMSKNAIDTSEVLQITGGLYVPGATNAAMTYLIWAPQVENGTALSSYIPTSNNAAVTRGADTMAIAIPAGYTNITIEYEGGSSTIAYTSSLNLGASSGGAWVGKYVKRVTAA